MGEEMDKVEEELSGMSKHIVEVEKFGQVEVYVEV